MKKYPMKEVSASVYAWDLHDEGAAQVLENLQKKAGVNTVYLIALMHEERHPWPESTDFPHNPARSSYMTEDSVAYWQVDERCYGRIKPACPTNFLAGTDWLALLIREARKRQMRVGVELSHTLIDSARLEHALADVCQVDIYGRPLTVTHIGDNHRVPCMNHPDVLEYAKNLYTEIGRRYDVDFIMNCMMPYPMPAPYLLAEYEKTHHPLDWLIQSIESSGCFCPSCMARARSMGFDLQRIREALLDMIKYLQEAPDIRETNTSLLEVLMAYPEYEQWIQFKCASVAAFHRELSACIHELRPEMDNRLNLYVTSHPEYAGFNGKMLSPSFDSVRICCYTENLGLRDAATVKRRVINSVKKSFSPETHLISAVGVLPGASPETVAEGIAVSCECGIPSIALGHYDGATFEMLEAVGQCVTTQV